MIGESIAIVIILLLAGAMALRSEKRAMARMTLPFLSIPLLFLLGEGILYSFRQKPGFPLLTVRIGMVILGGGVGIAAAWAIARSLAKEIKGIQRAYLPFAAVFLVAMLITYCIRLAG